MSSFIRRIQRTQHPSQAVHYPKGADGNPDFSQKPYANPPRKVFFKGRGSKLGVHNLKAKDLLARLAREAKRALARSK